MKKLLVLVVLAALPAALGACQSCEGAQVRFWRVRDAGGAVGYAVDTPTAPFATIDVPVLDGQGRKAPIEAREMTEISESDWRAGTSGAGYRVSYCMKMRTCWAAPVAK